MDDKVFRKMGEVLAFAKFGEDTMKKGQNAMTKAFGEEFVTDFNKKNNAQIETLYEIANAHGKENVMCEKSEKTFIKFEKMRDVYLHDEWNDAIEIMEWLGFFEGAAIVHWSLIIGLSTKLDMAELLDIAKQGKAFHQDLLHAVTSKIAQ